MKKILSVLTVLCMVISMAAVPASASTIIKTYLIEDLTKNEKGEITTKTDDFTVLIKDSENNSSAYHEKGDDFLTIRTTSDFAVSGEAGTTVRQISLTNVTETFELKARVSFAGQNGEISWRPEGVNEKGNNQRIKTLVFDNGTVLIDKTETTLKYDTSKTYDMVILYQTATKVGAADAKIMISLSDGESVSRYVGSVPSGINLSTIAGSSWCVNRVGGKTNELKLYNGWSFASAKGIAYFGNELANDDFDNYTTESFCALDRQSGDIYYYIQQSDGNSAEITDEANGAYSGKSAKLMAVKASNQIRIPTAATAPVRFEYRIKAESIGSSGVNMLSVESKAIFKIGSDRNLKFNGDTVTNIAADKWYLIRGYNNPVSDYAYVEVTDPNGNVYTASGIIENDTSLGYMNLFSNVGSTIYVDDLCVREASPMIGTAASDSFSVTTAEPFYDSSITVGETAKISFNNEVNTDDFTAENIYICKDGRRIEASGFSWSEDKKTLSIPINETGHYRICLFALKDNSSNIVANPYLEFDAVMPKPDFGSSYVKTDFNDWTNDKIPTKDGSYVDGIGFWIQSGNTISLVDEANGAYDGNALKFTVGNSASSQLRVVVSKTVPTRFTFRLKADSFGNGFNLSSVNSIPIFEIRSSGGVFTAHPERPGIETLNAGEWYLFRGYCNPVDNYISLELSKNNGMTYSRLFNGAIGAAKTDLRFFFATNSVMYIDDLYIEEASVLVGNAGTEDFAVKAINPTYYASMPVYYDAQLTLNKAADTSEFTAKNIYIEKDGVETAVTSFSWNDEKTVLSIPMNETGHYRICVFELKDANGNAMNIPYMEFDVTEPEVLIKYSSVEEKYNYTATIRFNTSDLNSENVTLIVAGYKGGILYAAPVVAKQGTQGDGYTEMKAVLTTDQGLSDVRAYVWENMQSIKPLMSATQYR